MADQQTKQDQQNVPQNTADNKQEIFGGGEKGFNQDVTKTLQPEHTDDGKIKDSVHNTFVDPFATPPQDNQQQNSVESIDTSTNEDKSVYTKQPEKTNVAQNTTDENEMSQNPPQQNTDSFIDPFMDHDDAVSEEQPHTDQYSDASHTSAETQSEENDQSIQVQPNEEQSSVEEATNDRDTNETEKEKKDENVSSSEKDIHVSSPEQSAPSPDQGDEDTSEKEIDIDVSGLDSLEGNDKKEDTEGQGNKNQETSSNRQEDTEENEQNTANETENKNEEDKSNPADVMQTAKNNETQADNVAQENAIDVDEKSPENKKEPKVENQYGDKKEETVLVDQETDDDPVGNDIATMDNDSDQEKESQEPTVTEELREELPDQQISKLIEKFNALYQGVKDTCQLEDLSVGESFDIVGADNDRVHINYAFSYENEDTKVVVITKDETDREQDEQHSNFISFVYDTQEGGLDVYVNDTILYDHTSLEDNEKKKMEVIDKLNKFTFLVTEHYKKLKKAKEERKELKNIFRNF